MFKNKSNKQKFRLLLVSLVMLAWGAYQFSFSRTIDLWKECRRLEKQQALIKDIPTQLPVLNQEIEQLEKILGNSGDEDFSALILQKIDMLCQQNNVKLNEIPEKHVLKDENLNVETLSVNMQGSFSHQLAVISEMENSDVKARLRSFQIQSIIHPVTGEHSLQSVIYLQSVKLLSNNKITPENEK